MRISAAAFGAFGAELVGEASDSRDSFFLRVASSILIVDFGTAEYFDHTGLEVPVDGDR